DSGFQAALMAPTEILADQHFRKIAAWMEPLGIKVAWLTGSLKKKEKSAAQALIESGEAQLVIGTHALIQDAVQFAKLGLVIVELPPGRSPIVTRAIDQNRRDEVIARVHAAALEGRQVYWVCPLIEESEALQLQTATDTHATLVQALPDLAVGLVHGRMKPG